MKLLKILPMGLLILSGNAASGGALEDAGKTIAEFNTTAAKDLVFVSDDSCSAVRKAPSPPKHKESVTHHANLPFDMETDSLCFGNDTFVDGPWPLDRIATGFGACQGMVGVARAFKYFAKFTCTGKKTDSFFVGEVINAVMMAQKSNCSDKPVEIFGYCSLQEFCEANTKVFRKRVVQHNADLSVTGALAHMFELKAGATAQAQINNMGTIAELYRELKAGRSPMMLYPWHVVMVTGLTIKQVFVPGRADYQVDHYEVTLELYNPNDFSERDTRVITIDKDFKRTVGTDPIFMVNPEQGRRAESCSISNSGPGF